MAVKYPQSWWRRLCFFFLVLTWGGSTICLCMGGGFAYDDETQFRISFGASERVRNDPVNLDAWNEWLQRLRKTEKWRATGYDTWTKDGNIGGWMSAISGQWDFPNATAQLKEEGYDLIEWGEDTGYVFGTKDEWPQGWVPPSNQEAGERPEANQEDVMQSASEFRISLLMPPGQEGDIVEWTDAWRLWFQRLLATQEWQATGYNTWDFNGINYGHMSAETGHGNLHKAEVLLNQRGFGSYHYPLSGRVKFQAAEAWPRDVPPSDPDAIGERPEASETEERVG